MRELSLEIPYIILNFLAEFSDDTLMPADKVSALRGGMGNMLLRQNCVSDGVCERCMFQKACVVCHTLYSYMELAPAYVTGKESVGYLIECEDRRTGYRRGESFSFRLILFGESIVFFNQYLQAFCQLGMSGLGKNRSRFQIGKVTDSDGQCIVDGSTVDMNRYKIRMLEEYVQQRRERLQQGSGSYVLRFVTPLCMKYQGEFLRKFQSEAVLKGALRRVQMLNYFVGNEAALPELSEYPEVTFQKVGEGGVRRYSSTQDSQMKLRGITGEIWFKSVPAECLEWLIAGELIHIGKNTSFGFGKYLLDREDQWEDKKEVGLVKSKAFSDRVCYNFRN